MRIASALAAAAVGFVGSTAGLSTIAPVAATAPDLPVATWTPLEGTATRTAATYVDSDDVVHYPFDPAALPGYVLARDSGQHGPDGCEFSGEGSGTPSAEQQVTKITEVEFDPATCTRILAVATYAISEVPSSVQDSLDASDGGESSLSTTANRSVSIAAASYSGYLKANVEDPPGINVSSTRSAINWTATSSCVTSSTRSPQWSWFSASGWSRTSGTILSDYMTCARAYLNIAGQYKNDAFCPGSGNTTFTNHSKTIFEGNPGGGYYWAYTMAKSGGCSSLLHYDYDLSHP